MIVRMMQHNIEGAEDKSRGARNEIGEEAKGAIDTHISPDNSPFRGFHRLILSMMTWSVVLD